VKKNLIGGLSKNVWSLGWVSLFNDFSSEMDYPHLVSHLYLWSFLWSIRRDGKSLVADPVEEPKRGTAYGAYNFSIGLAALPASLLMGFIWKTIGVQWAFTFGAVMALIAALLAMLLMGNPQ
jgi:sugar phosphate permease